jgi:uncharacterized protein (DUF302 family)
MFLIGLLVGIVLMVVLIRLFLPGKMFVVKQSKFGFDETIANIEKSATDMNWGLPHKYDLQATLKGKGFEVDPVNVISMCKPSHANNVLSDDKLKQMSGIMPCRVSVYQKKGKTYVSILNAVFLSKMMGSKAKDVMGQVGAEMEVVIRPVVK